MHRIVHLESDSVRATLRRPDFPHLWQEHGRTLPGEIEERCAGASIVIVNKLVFDAARIARLPELRLIALAATGANNIDLDACRARGIVVSNIRGYAVHTVPEHVIALLMALSRNLFAYRTSVAEGRWQRAGQFCFFDHPIRDLHGQTLGILGSGSLGSGVAKLATAFGMNVLLGERKAASEVRPGHVAFDTLLAESDAISLHCPLTAETRGLIGAAEIARMRPGAILINTARGGLIDEAALAAALKSGALGGAAIDVLSEEPPVNGNVLLDPELLALPNFILTPHVAWASAPAMQALADQLIANIEAFAAGAPNNRLA